VNRKTQVIVTTIVWLVCLIGIAAAARFKGGLPQLATANSGEVCAAETGQEACNEPSAPPPATAEAAKTAPAASPIPAFVGPPAPVFAPPAIPVPPLGGTVAQTGPSADLLPPVTPSTAEPPLETTSASAKPPEREDNAWSTPPRLARPHATEESSVALCLWSSVGKVKTRTRIAKGRDEGPFVGTFCCSLDEDKGLVLPQKASELMGLPRHVYVTPGPDECLWLCSAAGLEKLTAKLGSDARRLYYAQTSRVAVDRTGRIALPESVGCVRQNAVLIGAGDHFELWDAQRLQRYVVRKSAK
jgi:DNA-binding transcriptional regulator/RsmH inhibitor MraZ